RHLALLAVHLVAVRARVVAVIGHQQVGQSRQPARVLGQVELEVVAHGPLTTSSPFAARSLTKRWTSISAWVLVTSNSFTTTATFWAAGPRSASSHTWVRPAFRVRFVGEWGATTTAVPSSTRQATLGERSMRAASAAGSGPG